MEAYGHLKIENICLYMVSKTTILLGRATLAKPVVIHKQKNERKGRVFTLVNHVKGHEIR